jgi:hypothetical protein
MDAQLAHVGERHLRAGRLFGGHSMTYVGVGEERWRDREAESLCGFEVDDQLDFPDC